ncbi:EI24 domain-containing protein [Burkholderia singularis]|uniref:Probable transmembrane protein n=1 Tax=Burkholderia singularis TaxID=1503053 RepID=A0A238H7D7_9BURK|nr:EI24 domain-containing protein [Burkholderia singularis]SMG00983.1 Probable transmembrane protein [Burkholderia singularis]
MNDLLRSFGRALAGALHPRMLWLTFVPFIVAAVVWGVVLWFTWQPLVDAARTALDGFALTALLYKFFNAIGASQLHAVVAPFVVVSLAIPLIALTVLLLIATLSMPAVVNHLSKRSFATLEMKRGGTWFGSVFNSLGAALASLVVLVVTVPLWLIPPFFALLPPVIFGWLTYRVMSYDALASHASRDERRALMRTHRWPLLGIGIACGLLGTVPTFVWVSSIWMMVLFPFVAAAMIWVYAFILVFSALWFGFYCLRALEDQRAALANAAASAATSNELTRRA